jgi:hypothetical protein
VTCRILPDMSHLTAKLDTHGKVNARSIPLNARIRRVTIIQSDIPEAKITKHLYPGVVVFQNRLHLLSIFCKACFPLDKDEEEHAQARISANVNATSISIFHCLRCVTSRSTSSVSLSVQSESDANAVTRRCGIFLFCT